MGSGSRPYTTAGGKTSHGTAAAYPDRARELRLPADAGYGLLAALSLPVTPDRCRYLVPGRCSVPSRPLTTTRDIEDGSGSLVGPLVQDRIGRAGEDQEFSRRRLRTNSQNVYSAALLVSLLSRGLPRRSAS